jgi:hypothetical protein
MMKPPSCQEEVFFSNRDCSIWQCRCGIYHVKIHTIRLHLTTAQFERVARLFKLMMGRAAGIAAAPPALEAPLEASERKIKREEPKTDPHRPLFKSTSERN